MRLSSPFNPFKKPGEPQKEHRDQTWPDHLLPPPNGFGA
jgi:hypothetical protein